MLKLVDKIIYIHEGETIYFGDPFECHNFISKVLKLKLNHSSNPLCTISHLLNKNIAKMKNLKDSTQNRLLVTYESYRRFQGAYFIGELEGKF